MKLGYKIFDLCRNLILFLIFTTSVYSQVEEPYDDTSIGVIVDSHLSTDTTIYSLDRDVKFVQSLIVIDTIIREEDLSKYYSNDEFSYIHAQKNSLMEDFRALIEKWLSNFFDNKDVNKSSKYIEYIINTILVIALLILIYFILKVIYYKEGKWVFKKKVKEISSEYSISEEEYNRNDFHELIQNFEGQSDYKNAIRFYYVWALKSTIEKYHLTFHPHKTSQMYLNELKILPVHEEFEKITYLFNNIWYGDHSINAQQYSQSISLFQKIVNK